MQHITIMCDRCKQVIESDRSVLRIMGGALGTLLSVASVEQARDTLDLCSACDYQFTRWLRRQEPSPTPEPETPAEPPADEPTADEVVTTVQSPKRRPVRQEI